MRRSPRSTTTTRPPARPCSTRTPRAAPTPVLAATPGAGRSSPRARTPSARRTPTSATTWASPTAAGEASGRNGIGSGRMPGFGDNPNPPDVEGDGMLTPDMIAAIARYEATLPNAEPPAAPEQAPPVGDIPSQ